MILSARAVFIHLMPNASKSLDNMADNQYYKPLKLSPYRGSIYDRRGEALAISIRLPTLCVNPHVFKPDSRQLHKLAKITGIPTSKIRELSHKKSYFAYFLRKTNSTVAKKALDLEIRGLYQIMEPSRSYPNGSLAAPLLGFVGSEDNGAMGLERQYNRDLKGESIQITPSKDARGHTIYLNGDGVEPQKTGNNLHLTIDSAIQQITESALEDGVKRAAAKAGYAIVSDPHTGRILAVANYPTYNPNATENIKLTNAKNRAFMDVFEPGSVMKPFVVAEALEKKLTAMSSLHDCEMGKLKIGRTTIHDVKPNKYLSTEQVLVKSSNVCTYKIASKLGPEGLYDTFLRFGFSPSKPFITGFPGEARGRISDWKHWRPIRFANVSFGQGITATGLEIVRAFGALANGGKIFHPQIIDRIESSDGLLLKSLSPKESGQVISPEIAREVRGALKEVVEQSVQNGRPQHFSAGGKTGTSQKVDPILKKYSETMRIASFAGFAPADDPYIVVYVYVDEPSKRPYFGTLWAAPVFKEIAEKTLNYLNVKPTEPQAIIGDSQKRPTKI